MSLRKFFVYTPDDTAITFYRIINNYKNLKNLKPEQIQIFFSKDLNLLFQDTFDYLVFHSLLSHNTAVFDRIYNYCKQNNIQIIIDIDDYWKPDDVYLKKYVRQTGYEQKLLMYIQKADIITTTTEYLKSKILPYNSHVFIIPNAIDKSNPLWYTDSFQSERIRIGFVGGIYHYLDLMMLQDAFRYIAYQKQLHSKIQIVLGGFTNITKYLYYKNDTLVAQQKKTDSGRWIDIEKMMTDQYRLIQDENYKRFLLQQKKDDNHIYMDQPYIRLWGTGVHHFMYMYDHIDVALIPLKHTEFNKCKSPLKLVEAGYKKKIALVSDLTPYKEYAKHKENCIVVKNKNKWKDALIDVIKNYEQYKKVLPENLYKTITEVYEPMYQEKLQQFLNMLL